jgi:hypothetical protein
LRYSIIFNSSQVVKETTVALLSVKAVFAEHPHKTIFNIGCVEELTLLCILNAFALGFAVPALSMESVRHLLFNAEEMLVRWKVLSALGTATM